MYLVEKNSSQQAIGLCGLLKRETREDVDIGFALHLDFWRQGYAREAANAGLDYARDQLFLTRLIANALPTNQASIALLKAIGTDYQRELIMGDDAEILSLFSKALR